jgi:hypothetical protein
MKPTIKKEIFSVNQLSKMGYPLRMLQTLVYSDDFSRFGFRTGTGRTSKYYIDRRKLDRYLEHQMDDHGGVLR